MEQEALKKWLNEVDVTLVEDILVDLVKLPSENPGGTEQAVALYCKQFLEQIGYEVKLVELEPDRNNVMARKKGAGNAKPIAFSGHMDVVPVNEVTVAEWTYPPFSGTKADGYIWGRGAGDMKGGIAASLAAAKLLAESDVIPPGDILFALTVDEEALMRGAKQLASLNVLEGVGSAVICDTTDMHVEIASKGRTWADITVIGRSAHASLEHAGVNAIDGAMKLMQRLKQWPVDYKEHPKAGRFFWNVNMIKGGTEPAMVPDRCTITLDARLVPGQRSSDVWKRVQELLDVMHQEDETFQAVIDIVEEREPWELSSESALLNNFIEIGDMIDFQVVTGAESGTTDATFLAREGMDMAIVGPGRTEEIHCINERTPIVDLHRATRLYLGLMVNNNIQ